MMTLKHIHMDQPVSSPSSRFTVAVFGHVGQENLGDEAAFQALIDAVKVRKPGAEFIGISVDPVDTSRRYGIQAFPIWREVMSVSAAPVRTKLDEAASTGQLTPRSGIAGSVKQAIRFVPGLFPLMKAVQRLAELLPVVVKELVFLLRIYQTLRGVNVLAVAGSQHLNDYVLGPWNFPYTTFKWTVMAKLAGAKVVLLNVGAGPLLTSLGKWFIKQTIRFSDYQSYRDDSSVRCVRELGIIETKPSLPDMVFSLRIVGRLASVGTDNHRIVVGINPIPFNSADYWIGANQENYRKYILVMARLVQWTLEQGQSVVLFPTQLTLDPKVIADIRELLPVHVATSEYLTEASIKSIEDLAATISATDLVVASRFHGLVFSMLCGKPVLGIAYAEKTRDLMSYMGVGDCAIDIGELSFERLRDLVQAIEGRRELIKNGLQPKVLEARARVEAQFDVLFGARESSALL